MRTTTFSVFDQLPDALREGPKRRVAEVIGVSLLALVVGAGISLLSWSIDDPSLNHSTSTIAHNWLGKAGAIGADVAMQFVGISCVVALTAPAFWG